MDDSQMIYGDAIIPVTVAGNVRVWRGIGLGFLQQEFLGEVWLGIFW